jgi:hypothetical protein
MISLKFRSSSLLLVFISLLIFSAGSIYAQTCYKGMSHKFPKQDSIKKEIELSTLRAVSTAPALYNKEFKAFYEARGKKIIDELDHGVYLYDPAIYKYVDQIFRHIKDRNPILKDLKTRFFITCQPWPNASSLGEGTFLINIGLFSKIENEAQLAFILGHEMAHYYLKHADKSLMQHFTTINSKEFKDKVKSIEKAEFRANEQGKRLIREYVYDNRKHSRDHEFSADSMGLELIKNTDYADQGSVSCMQLLDTIDYYKYNYKIAYEKFLGSDEFPFRERWLEKEDGMFGGKVTQQEFFHRDSVKTHPDCSNRVELLKKQINSEKTKNYFIQEKPQLELLKRYADYEFIEGWQFFEDYGRCLFYTLQQLQAQPNDTFLLIKTGTQLRLIHESQINHNLSLHVQKPGPSYEEDYGQMLELIDNLRISELSGIGYSFHKTRLSAFSKNEEFLFNYIYFCKAFEKTEELAEARKMYLKEFPAGQYLATINAY